MNIEEISVVLVSPKGALNVGSVARLMANFGFSDLRIVLPRCDLRSSDCKQMAVHAYHLVEKAKIFQTLSEALADRTVSIALSGRREECERPVSLVQNLPSEIFSRFSKDEKIALVFGREEIGLLLEELSLCKFQVLIPASEEYSSLNLSSAAAIVFYQIFLCGSSETSAPIRETRILATERQRHLLMEKFFSLLHRTPFLNPENPVHLRDDFWALLHRADLDERELRILFGVLTAFESRMPSDTKH